MNKSSFWKIKQVNCNKKENRRYMLIRLRVKGTPEIRPVNPATIVKKENLIIQRTLKNFMKTNKIIK